MAEKTSQPTKPWSPLPLLWALLLNAVPLYGVLVLGWSWGTGFALYCCEYLLSVLFAVLRMVIHRRLTGKRGYLSGNVDFQVSVNGKPRRRFRSNSAILELLMTSLGASVGMGFLFAVVFGLALAKDPGAAIHPQELQKGLTATVLLMLMSFLVDLWGIHDRPYAWIRAINQSAMDRMGVIIFTLFLGLVASSVLEAPIAFFWVFIAFKLLADIVRVLPHGKRSAELSPRQRKTSGKFKDELARKRREELEEEERQAAMDEEVVPSRE